MNFYKKWLNIAIVFILSFSLLSPAALANTQQNETNETDTAESETSSTINNQLNDEEANILEKDISQSTETELSSNTTNDSATIHNSEPKGYVTVSVEKFTLGQGYIKEPVRVPFYEKDNVAQVVVNLLGDGNYDSKGSVYSSFYLASIYDPNPGEVKVPQYILNKAGSITKRYDPEWLGEFDYTDQSGWMVAVNNNFIPVGASDWFPNDGDVIRWQFTVSGLGADLGGGFEGNNYIIPAKKDALTAKIAEINSAPNKVEILANANVQSAYDAAYAQLTNMESSQPDVDKALNQLIAALNGNGEEVDKADKKALQAAIQQAEITKASVKVSVDGKDVAPTGKWVTQSELNTYEAVIKDAQALIANEAATQEEIKTMESALNKATEAFNEAKKAGLQRVPGETKFTVPKDAELFIGKKIRHFIGFEEITPEGEVISNEDGTKTYSFKLVNGGEYNYRVSQAGKLTNTGTFKANEQNASLAITKEQLEVQSPNAILNKGTYLEGNIYLNINEQNHLKLNEGDTFKLLSLRSWQALIEGINNYYFEPDFHYEIITGKDVIAIEPGKPGSYSTVKALKNGTAIVKVSYDALKVNGSAYITGANDAFSAIWPENVGLFVVTVGQSDTGISTGIESNKERNKKANEGKTGNALMNLSNGAFDADIDSVYYAQDQRGAYYTFTPTTGSTVSVLRPKINHEQGTASYGDGTFSKEDVQSSKNGSFTVLLTEGRNIVKVEKNGRAEYHVMTARPLDITIENLTKPNAKVTPGDKVKVTFKGLSFPANKLAGIYNFNAQLNFIGGPEQQLIAGLKRQYNITTQANDVTFTIPENHRGAYILKEGHIKLGFYGSPMGDHRNINPTTGVNPNLNALEREGYYSIFPEITIIAGEKVVIDKSLLQSAIDKAKQNKATVKVSADGKDIAPADYWVTQAAQDAYTNIIVSAQQLIADENAIQENIDAKVLALDQATMAFNDVKKAGTKSNADTQTSQAYNTVAKFMVDKLPNPKFGNEWWILTLARGGYEVPAGYYDTYYKNVVDYVVSKDGVLDKRKYTEYSRLIITLTAIKKDPTNVGGYNLVEKLSDFDQVVWQGVNGAYFGLIALNTWDFELSKTATTTREKLIEKILEKQLADGGWDLSDRAADPDMTAMAIQSLAPYYKTNSKVKDAIDKALTTLTDLQLENGGYKSWGTENVESAAQVVTALASLGIDANKDPRFNKVIANIMTYYNSADGGFKHVLSDKQANGMATEQVGYTLAAYHRLLNGQTALYDMSDTKSQNPSNPGDGGNPSNPGNGGNPSTPGDGGNNNSGNGGDNNNPGGSLPSGHTKFLIKISSSEVPLRTTSVELYPGETVFDVLKRVTAENGIALSYRETQYGTYIDGIDGLYEFDRGPLSGWMYRVNGHFPAYSAALYTLSPGDSVEWLYTLDLGKDVGGYVDGIENGGAGGENKDKCKGKETEDCKEADKKCTGQDEKCTEETKKEDNGSKESDGSKEKEENKEDGENKDSSVTEIAIKDGSNKAIITSENIQEYLEKNIKNLVIQSEDNFKLEVPTSIFTGIKLAKNEQIIASVTKEAKNKQFTVTFGIETAKGKIKSISLDKEYLKVTLAANELKPNTVVLQLDGSEYKPTPHKIVNGEIILFTKTNGTFVVTESTVTFKDIAHLANKEEIEFLASRFVIKGTTPETFEPNKPITRAQFAVLTSRALGLQATSENQFKDTEGKWYATDIQALFEAGITKGTTASTFNPEAPITRQQAAAFMARILEYLNADVKVNGEVNFNDVSKISAEYLPYIKLLNSLDIMTGKPDGSFDPGASLTRGQTAKILKRSLNIAGIM